MHGGARGSGAPRGNRNAWKHGLRSTAYRETARYVRASSRFLAAARLALRASALGPDIAGLAWRQAAAVWADMPAIPGAGALAMTGASRPSRPGVAPKKEETNEQAHAPGNSVSAGPVIRPGIAVADTGAGARSGPDIPRLARRCPPSPPGRSRYGPARRAQADGAAGGARRWGGIMPVPHPMATPNPMGRPRPMAPSSPMTTGAAAR